MMKRRRIQAVYLPAELCTDILSRLPPKTLLRFRCVCRTWLGVIESSDFEVMHLNLQKNNCCLLSAERRPRSEMQWSITCANTLEKISDIPSVRSSLKAEGYLNGLVLLGPDHLCEGPLILWNPSIRKHVIIPLPKTQSLSYDLSGSMVGIGYDATNNDYKVLALFHGVSLVYSLGKGCWKTLSRGAAFTARLVWREIKYIKDHMYYMVCCNDQYPASYPEDLRSEGWKLASFCVSNELFHLTALPPTNVKIKRPWMTGLSVLDDSITVLDFYKNYCWVWVMDKHSLNSDWVKRCSIDTRRFYNIVFYSLGKNGELFYVSKNKEIKSYGINTLKQRTIAKRAWTFIFLEDYVESLVLLKPRE
ncbi:hypothetical protein Droror1_Dr00018452 [Drosera rotundifolia]